MHYIEYPLAPEIESLAGALWTLEAAAPECHEIRHSATPDGCVEIIRRCRGRSAWHGDQPDCFVAGLIDRPAELLFTGDAAFVGLRLWPWTWHALGGRPCTDFINNWVPLEGAGLPEDTRRLFSHMDRNSAAGLAVLFAPMREGEFADVGAAVLASGTVAGLSRRTGRSMRWLQRWFARHVGIAPRTYLRLLRFQETLRAVQTNRETLTHQAFEYGYTDQAHMAREFRALTGLPASRARKKLRGPFL